MNEETRALITYRLQRANESLEEAKILLEQNHLNTYINRLYYACFYAISALMLTRNIASSKHSGVRSLFHQNFVKTGLIDINLAQFYDKLYDNRQKADYADFFHFELDDVSNWFHETCRMIEAIEKLTKKEMEGN